jgi:hypothetical protein
MPIKLSTWLCLKIRMQDEITVLRLIRVPSNGWKSSDIWEQVSRILNSIQEEVKSRLKSENACYYSVQDIIL